MGLVRQAKEAEREGYRLRAEGKHGEAANKFGEASKLWYKSADRAGVVALVFCGLSLFFITLSIVLNILGY